MIVVLAMTAILAVAAFAIDVAQWYTARHQAQVTADAAALAAANCMVASACTTNTAAQNMAISYAAKNGSTITASNVTFPTGTTVKVTVPSQQSDFFSGALGITPQAQSESATASDVQGTAPYALFADDTSCSDQGIDLNVNGHNDLSGGVHSNGNLQGQVGNNTTLGLMNYGCSNTLQDGNGSGSPTVPAVQTTAPLTWPVPYDSTSCELPSGTSCYFNPTTACTAPVGYTAGVGTPPTNVTDNSGNLTISGTVGSSTSSIVICDPSGTIAVSGNNFTIYGTLYAQALALSGNSVTITPPADDLGIYVTGTSVAVGTSKNNLTLNGAYVYAPNGTVSLAGNNGSGFVEAEDIAVTGNNWSFAGDGPTENDLFGDALVQ